MCSVHCLKFGMSIYVTQIILMACSRVNFAITFTSETNGGSCITSRTHPAVNELFFLLADLCWYCQNSSLVLCVSIRLGVRTVSEKGQSVHFAILVCHPFSVSVFLVISQEACHFDWVGLSWTHVFSRQLLFSFWSSYFVVTSNSTGFHGP